MYLYEWIRIEIRYRFKLFNNNTVQIQSSKFYTFFNFVLNIDSLLFLLTNDRANNNECIRCFSQLFFLAWSHERSRCRRSVRRIQFHVKKKKITDTLRTEQVLRTSSPSMIKCSDTFSTMHENGPETSSSFEAHHRDVVPKQLAALGKGSNVGWLFEQ